jgi:hypothetical protein
MKKIITNTKAALLYKIELHLLSLVLLGSASAASAQTTAFTYQGALMTSGAPANGNYDFQVSLQDASSNVLGGPLVVQGTVSNGLFTIVLDFGSGQLSGANRWLQLAVRTNGSGAFVPIVPRQQLTSAPYAIRAASASNFTNSIPDSQLSTNVARLNANNSFTGTNSLNSIDLRLRAFSDTTHGLGWYGGSKTFGGFAPDGPVLYGNQGGAFGTSSGGQATRVYWNIYGFGIGTNPATDFHVLGFTPQYTMLVESTNGIGTWLHLKNNSTNGRDWSMWSSGNGNVEGPGKFFVTDTFGYRLVLTTNGYAGMGTYTPQANLHVVGNNFLQQILFESSDGYGTWLHLKNTSANGHDWSIWSSGSGNGEGAGNLIFDDNIGHQMVLRTNGNVGIGTSAPAAQLHVTSSDYPTALFETSSATGTWLDLNNTSTNGTNWIILSTGSGNGEGPGKLMFDVGPAANSVSREGVMVLQGNGNVGIGTVTPNFTLEVNGTAGKPGGGTWTVSSDARLKKNIRTLSGALDKLLALRGVNFEYIDPQKIHELSGERMGLIAQEVEKVFPDWVETGPDGYKRVTVRGLEALVVESLRQLRTEQALAIREQENQLAALKREKDAEIQELKQSLSALSERVNLMSGQMLQVAK